CHQDAMEASIMTKLKSILMISCAAVALPWESLPAAAANITVGQNNGVPTIYVFGEILPGDGKKFDTVAAAFPQKTFVFLEGPGGWVTEGLDIAYTIRSHGFQTVVDAHRECLSMCGLIWLAGSTRWASVDAMIGFHCAWKGKGECSGAEN